MRNRGRGKNASVCVFERNGEKIGADAIALAHHRRDQAETVLLHAARGSDLRGLCAMRMRRGRFIRPFLNETPENIRAYLNQIGQVWREDETNACEDYARNRVRLTALPALEAACPVRKARWRGWHRRRRGMRLLFFAAGALGRESLCC